MTELQDTAPSPGNNSGSPRPFVVGIAGGTCSGKTTVAERLAERIGPDHLSLIRLDSYYVNRPHEPLEARAAADYDHPDAFDWDLLNLHLDELLSGSPVEVPVYDYVQHLRSPAVFTVTATPIIVIEGILVLHDQRLRDLFDLKVFVHADADLRLIRRMARDVAERGRSIESIVDQYLTTVRPSHELFVEPSRRFADVILPEGGHNDAALYVLLARIRELANIR